MVDEIERGLGHPPAHARLARNAACRPGSRRLPLKLRLAHGETETQSEGFARTAPVTGVHRFQHDMNSPAPRYGRIQITTSCDHCGAQLPINAPDLEVTCGACWAVSRVTPKVVAELVEDLDEKLAAARPGAVRAPTITFDRTYQAECSWSTPICGRCGARLPEVTPGWSGSLVCPSCATRHRSFPAPAWMRQVYSPATQIICSDSTASSQADAKPILMSCPRCGGGLNITADTPRAFTCQYCSGTSELPEPVWNALHPPATKVEPWFVRFEGLRKSQIEANLREQAEQARAVEVAERRTYLKDVVAEQAARVPRLASPEKSGHPAGALVASGCMFLVLFVAIGGFVVAALSDAFLDLGLPLEAISGWLAPALVGIVVLGLFVIAALRLRGRGSATWPGDPAVRRAWLACQRRLKAVARQHGLAMSAASRSYMGVAEGEIGGHEVRIAPSSEAAVEVRFHPNPWCISTHPRHRPDDVQWFRTGDPRFDHVFWHRYAKPDLVARLNASHAELAPIHWFLDRWERRLARLTIAGFGASAHLLPGAVSSTPSTRYLPADALDPLLRDLLMLAGALEAQARGKQPELASYQASMPSRNGR